VSIGPPTIRIASYNIRKALGTDRRRDPERTLRVINTLRADVVVLQEADMRLGPRPAALPADLINARTGLTPVSVPGAVSIGWHGNAVLLRADATVESVDHLDLPGIEPRGAMVVDATVCGRPLRIIAAHLGLARPSRRAQLTALFDHLNDRPARPTMIAGDLNEWSQRVGLGRLARHFTIHAPGKSFHARLPMAALDRIALDDTLLLQDAGVVETKEARRASDHLPIWVDVAHVGTG
jgi:endonuclease/exonuclease/phosphatase family metal-dependent hydrolase